MTEFHYLYIWSKGQMFIMEKCQPLIWVLGSDLLIIAKFIHVLVIRLMKIHIMVWYLYMLPWIFVLNYVAWWWPSWKSIKHEQYTKNLLISMIDSNISGLSTAENVNFIWQWYFQNCEKIQNGQNWFGKYLWFWALFGQDQNVEDNSDIGHTCKVVTNP